MTITGLCNPKPPWINIFVAEAPRDVETLAKSVEQQCGRKTVVRILAGERMRDFAGLFAEFATQMQFPEYFGNNYNALRDCLTDLAWLPGDGYVLIIHDGVAMLAGEKQEDFAALLDLLESVCVEWARPIAEQQAWDRESVPLHIVLHGRSKDLTALRRRIQKSGVASTELTIG